MKLFQKRKKRTIALILAAAVAVGSLVAAVAATLAADPPKEYRLGQPNTLGVLPYGGAPFTFSTTGIATARLADIALGSFGVVGGNYSFSSTGTKTAGIAQIIRVATSASFMQDINIQIVDASKITG